MYRHVHIPPKLQEGAFLVLPQTHQEHLVHVACVWLVYSEIVPTLKRRGKQAYLRAPYAGVREE